MLKKDEAKSGNPSGKGLSRVNRNFLIFIFFLLLSFLLWYLNSLSREIDTALKYPVTYKNIPVGNTAEVNLPSKLSIMFKGQGYSIVRLKVSAKRNPVVIDLSEVSYVHDQKGGSGSYYIVTAPLITSFNNQLNSGCKITSVKPDTIFFTLN
jgi:hypothetical protein